MGCGYVTSVATVRFHSDGQPEPVSTDVDRLWTTSADPPTTSSHPSSRHARGFPHEQAHRSRQERPRDRGGYNGLATYGGAPGRTGQRHRVVLDLPGHPRR